MEGFKIKLRSSEYIIVVNLRYLKAIAHGNQSANAAIFADMAYIVALGRIRLLDKF